jgi:hypothetical protein
MSRRPNAEPGTPVADDGVYHDVGPAPMAGARRFIGARR